MAPSILYKYVGPRGVAILRSSSVRFTSPESLNDPFESRLPVVTRLARYAHTRQGVVFPEEQDATLKAVGTAYGITCFSEFPDNLLLWAHYADAHAGAVIGFRTDHASFRALGSLLPVEYRARRPVLTSAARSTLLPLLTTKSKHWAYEREWRVIARWDDVGATTTPWLKPFDPECIHVIVLGARASRRLKGQVLKWRHKHPATQLLQARLDSLRFGLFLDTDLEGEPAVVVGDSKHVPVGFELPFYSLIQMGSGTLTIRDLTSTIIPEKVRGTVDAQRSRASGTHVVVHGERPSKQMQRTRPAQAKKPRR